MQRRKIILYNPAAPYYTLPLQFLALASVIDREKFDVHIIDARIEKNLEVAHAKVLALLPQAACIGVSVITGTPIRDAIALTSLAKTHSPSIPVVWGGWHPSILPEQCLREGGADFCVLGQGEMTFVELLEALERGGSFESVQSLAYLHNGCYRETAQRKFIDINSFPPYDYGLLPLPEYFALKGRRQLDFYSSQGCPYRCGFCADPYVYNRRWSGLRSDRLFDQVFDAVTRYAIDDVVFQDENFFANRNRVADFCAAIAARGMSFSWTATSRADQIAPLDDGFLKSLSDAHLRKVIIGAESGSQELLDRMKKDTLTEETLISAANLKRHNLSAVFGFIVGLPEEGFANTLQTLATIKEIKRIDPNFEFNVFFFTPYPGTALFDEIVAAGYKVPQTLAEWSDLDFLTYAGYWLRPEDQEYVRRFKFYARVGTERRYSGVWARPFQAIAAARLRNDFYRFPIEMQVHNIVRSTIFRREAW